MNEDKELDCQHEKLIEAVSGGHVLYFCARCWKRVEKGAGEVQGRLDFDKEAVKK